jgi:hypothetical protein
MKLILILFLTPFLTAQTTPVWFPVTVGSNISLSLPAGTTYRQAPASGTLGPSITATAVTVLPASSAAISIQVLETAKAQTLTPGAIMLPITVPALPTPTPTPAPAKPPVACSANPAQTTCTVKATYTCTVNLYSDGSFLSSSCTAVK